MNTSQSPSRFTRSSALAGIATLIAASSAARAQSLTTVTIGIPNAVSDAPLLIADKLGFFREQGIAAKIVQFRGTPEMIAPLGVGQLDVGGAAPAASLYNAIGTNVDIRMVADKGSIKLGYGYGPLLVRKDLVTSGKFKTPRDLRGMKVAEATPGTANGASLARLLEINGVGYNEIQHVYVAFPQQVVAFANGAIDASVLVEPYALATERAGNAVRIMGNDKWYPKQEQSVLMYGGQFAKKKDLATRFMLAYLKGVRFYSDALVGGHLRGRTAKAVIDTLVEATPLKDRTIYPDIVANYVDPNGRMSVVSLAEDLNFFKREGFVKSNVTIADSVDTSFQEEALRQLGLYKPHV